jgi:hypothetical protein
VVREGRFTSVSRGQGDSHAEKRELQAEDTICIKVQDPNTV